MSPEHDTERLASENATVDHVAAAPGGNGEPSATGSYEAPSPDHTADHISAPEARGGTVDFPSGPALPEDPHKSETVDGPTTPPVAEVNVTIDQPAAPAGPTDPQGTVDAIPAPSGESGLQTTDFPSAPQPTGLRHGGASEAGPQTTDFPSAPQPTGLRHGGATGIPPVGGYRPVAPEMRSGRYLLKKFHAKGGMGEVWLAEDCEIGRPVALKKMFGGARPDQEERFLLEAQVTGQLEHPGIVPVHEVGVDEEGKPFYAMKFIQGRTLKDVIAEYHAPPKPGAPPREVQGLRLLEIFLDVCQAVAYAHSRGVIHRDLKPDNIMVGAYGETLLLDWGLAKPAGGPEFAEIAEPVRFRLSGESLETHDGLVKGTPSYMSPEVAEGRVADVDQVSDIYLLGSTLYQILTGKRPRQAKKVSELIELARKTPPTPPRKLDKTIPKPLEAICLKAMAHRKEDRYQSATALAEDVQRYLAGEPVEAYRENFWERTWRWMRRHRVALGRCAVVLFVVGLVAFGAEEIRKANERRQAELKEAADRLALSEERRLAEDRENKLTLKLVEAEQRETKRQADEAKREAAERKRKEDALAQLAHFRTLSDEAAMYSAFQDPGSDYVPYYDLEKGENVARTALFLLLTWGTDLSGLALEDKRAEAREEVYELVLLTAYTTARRAAAGPEAARAVLALLDLAAEVRPPTASCHRLRAEAYRLLRDADRADAEQRRADDPKTPAAAVDYFLAGERFRTAHARQGKAPGDGKEARGSAQLTNAIAQYRKALTINQKHFWSLFQLGHCYIALGKYDQAVAALGACVALKPNLPWGYTMRGLALALLQRDADALDDLNKAIELRPSFRSSQLNRGLVHLMRGRYKEAMIDFNAVLEAPPEERMIEAAFYRGQLYARLGKWSEALADFNAVAAEKRGAHPVYLQRAMLYLSRGDVKKGDVQNGLADLNHYLAFGRPEAQLTWEMLTRRGRLLREKCEQFQLALADLERAEKLGGRSAELYDELGTVRENLNPQELPRLLPLALRAYDKSLQIAPKSVLVLVKRGWAHQKMAALLRGDEQVKEYKAALADFGKAVALDPTYSEAYAGMGYVQACMGKMESGTRHANLAVLHGIGDYLALHNAACVYAKLSEKDKQRSRLLQEMALDLMRREVELWRRDYKGPNPIGLLRNEEPGFPQALREHPEFRKLLEDDPWSAFAIGVASCRVCPGGFIPPGLSRRDKPAGSPRAATRKSKAL
jgi:tetratricopeptide (TPR) repeat protein